LTRIKKIQLRSLASLAAFNARLGRVTRQKQSNFLAER